MTAFLKIIRFSALFLAAVFCFQILEIPFPALKLNPKTCCGRAICQCTHAKGALCPFQHKEKNVVPPAETEHAHCHFPASRETKIPAGKNGFAKAPCASDTPKTLLPEYSKDFILPVYKWNSVLVSQSQVLSFPRSDLPLPLGASIERPPRIF